MARKPAGTPLSERYTWNPRIGATGGYYDHVKSRIVGRQEIQGALDEYVKASKATMQGYTESLKAGELSVADWRRLMREEIKDTHRTALIVERGGINQVTHSDWSYLGGRLTQQYRWLDNFANEIVSGKQKLNGTATVRAGMYADAGRATYTNSQRRSAALNGYTLARRVLGRADHCIDCLDEAVKGWQPLGALRPIGDSACRTNCRCHFAFKRAQPR